MNRASMLALALTTLLLMPLSIAEADPLFDGQWRGEGKPTSSCAETASLTFTIKDGDFVDFSFTGPRGSTTTVRGRVLDNGIAEIEYGRAWVKGSLQFQGNSFSGKMESNCGIREVTGQRVG